MKAPFSFGVASGIVLLTPDCSWAQNANALTGGAPLRLAQANSGGKDLGIGHHSTRRSIGEYQGSSMGEVTVVTVVSVVSNAPPGSASPIGLVSAPVPGPTNAPATTNAPTATNAPAATNTPATTNASLPAMTNSAPSTNGTNTVKAP